MLKFSTISSIFLLVFTLVGCDTEDQSYNSAHPKFPDLSTRQHQRSASENAATGLPGGTNSGPSTSSTTSSQSNNTLDNMLSADTMKFISECRYLADEEIRIDKTQKIIQEVKYDYDYTATSCDPNLRVLEIVSTYKYVESEQNFNSADIITMTYVSSTATVLDANYAQTANSITLFDTTGWKEGVAKDISSYIGEFTSVSYNKIIKIENNTLYIDGYYKYIMPDNYDITKQGKPYTKIN